ncbi:hypothetical protein N9F53_02370, partial [Bacteroidia bacterium]|nr:hypothetical protein [Bacteroidia bacterium]
MLNKDHFKKYIPQSFFLKLKELAADTANNPFAFKMVFFGGTGAVGGQAVIEILESYKYMTKSRVSKPTETPQLIITGINKAQIDQFCSKLFQIFDKNNFKKIDEQG